MSKMRTYTTGLALVVLCGTAIVFEGNSKGGSAAGSQTDNAAPQIAQEEPALPQAAALTQTAASQGFSDSETGSGFAGPANDEASSSNLDLPAYAPDEAALTAAAPARDSDLATRTGPVAQPLDPERAKRNLARDLLNDLERQ